MRFSRYAAMAVVGALCFSGQASAMAATEAQVSSVKGSVVVDHDGRLTSLAPNAVLNAGDRIVSMSGAETQIKFADGCAMPVRGATVVTVGATSPCTASGLIKTASPMEFGDAGTVLLGLLGVGLVVWAVWDASGGDKDNFSLSP